ncbi:MAG: NAD(P)-dependent alcohol dehydrogenase [Clostridiales bacterium]|nr:NAD(P)-dependent alcohol dehydrogenase [Clostridiales bacterium]
MKIKAAVVYERKGSFVLKNVELAEPRETEILVRMAGCGICHNDLFTKDEGAVPLPAVLGHEGSGVVERIGNSVTMVSPGDHVVFCSYSCGVCEPCLTGHPAACVRSGEVNFGGAYADGTRRLKDEEGRELSCFFGQSSFATWVVADQRSAVKVDKDVDLAMLGPLGCGLQTGAGAVLNVLKPGAGDTIAVFGCGSVGLSAVMAAKIAGCSTIIGIDAAPVKLDAAKELGATHVIGGAEGPDITAKILEITNGRGTDCSFETTGVETLFMAAIESLRMGGACGTVASTGTRTLDFRLSSLMGSSKKLVGIVQGDSVPWLFIPKLIRFYKEGRFPIDKLIRYYPFEEINKAAADAHGGAVIKPVLRF